MLAYLVPIGTVDLYRIHKALVLLGGPEMSARSDAVMRLLTRPERHTRKPLVAVADRILCDHVAQTIRNLAPLFPVFEHQLFYFVVHVFGVLEAMWV